VTPALLSAARGREAAMPLRLSTVETNAGALFALGVLSMAYVLNQVDRYSLSVVRCRGARVALRANATLTQRLRVAMRLFGAHARSLAPSQVSKPLERGVGFGDREGGGVEYDVLVGPVFTVVYIVSGLGFGVLGDRRSRKHILCAALFVWSAATALMGAATAYWQLILLRAVQGFGEAGCTPPAAAMIADIFLPRHRGKALGVFQWGVYVGYSLAFGVINVTTQHLGFRAAFLVVGAPGILLAALILATVREPPRQLPTRDPAAPAPLPVQDSAEADPPPVAAAAAAKSDTNESAASASARPQSPALTPRRVLDVLLLVARSPPLLLLCVGGSIRNAAGIVWAYNVNSFFQNQHNLSHEQIAAYLSWIPLVAGSLGSALGGILADRIFTRHGNFGRCVSSRRAPLRAPAPAPALATNRRHLQRALAHSQLPGGGATRIRHPALAPARMLSSRLAQVARGRDVGRRGAQHLPRPAARGRARQRPLCLHISRHTRWWQRACAGDARDLGARLASRGALAAISWILRLWGTAFSRLRACAAPQLAARS
jgi:MFS family permease